MAISIVIPAYNEELYIKSCLARIRSCINSSLEVEIIVVDNASTDNTPKILQNIPSISLITLTQKVTVSQARNIGWRQAKNNIVVFIDADVLLTEKWAEELITNLPLLHNKPASITGCRYTLSEQPSLIEKTWFTFAKKGNETYINSGNLITTKHLLNAINGFNEDLITGEDVDFCARAKKAGAELVINYGYLAHHEGYPKTLASFYKRERWHGKGDLKNFSTFMNSKVAIFSFLFSGLLALAAVSLAAGNYHFSIAFVLLAIVLNLAVVFYKFTYSNIRNTIYLCFLNCIYAIARTASFFSRKTI